MRNIFRLLAIIYNLRAFRIDKIIAKRNTNVSTLRFLKFLQILLFWVPDAAKNASDAQRIRLLLEHLGALWIKLGQLLSLQEDFFTIEEIDELTNLQDKVAPFSNDKAWTIFKNDLKVEANSLFTKVNPEVIASGSIAQVYLAKLDLNKLKDYSKAKPSSWVKINNINDFDYGEWAQRVVKQQGYQQEYGEDSALAQQLQALDIQANDFTDRQVDVVVKVLRPDVVKKINSDLNLLEFILKQVRKFFDKNNRLRGSEIMLVLRDSFKVELDLSKEALNGTILRQQWNNEQLYVPKVFLASPNVMVVERLFTTPFNKVTTFEPAVNLELLAEYGVEIFFKQLLEKNFFHADMHPGNIFIDTTDVNKPFYNVIDFGICSWLDEINKKYLVSNLMAFFQQDYRKIAQLHIDSGWIKGFVDINALEISIRQELEPVANLSLNEMNFSLVLAGLFRIAREYGMIVQPQLLMLEKTLIYVESMGRFLYPELNLWKTALPHLQHWFTQEYSYKTQIKNITQNLPEVINTINHLPDYAYRFQEEQIRQGLELQELNHKLSTFGKWTIFLAIINLVLIVICLSVFYK